MDKLASRTTLAILLTLTILNVIPTIATEVWQDENTAIPIINFENGYDKIKQYLQTTSTIFDEPLGYPNDKIVAVGNQLTLSAVWPNRYEYGIIYFSYHSLNNNEYLRNFVADRTSSKELVQWIYDGGSLCSVLKDPADIALATLLNLTLVNTGVDPNEIPFVPGTPFIEGISDNQIESDGGFARYGFLDNSTHPLPDWVDIIAAERDGVPIFIAGKFGKGLIIVSGAEWLDTISYAWAPGVGDFTQFHTNVLNYIHANSEWVAPTKPYYSREEVDALIAEEVNSAVDQAVTEAVAQIMPLIPDVTMAYALGGIGLILGIVAIAIAFTRK
jgi:hypothetical protein